jgi:hypothetical protein
MTEQDSPAAASQQKQIETRQQDVSEVRKAITGDVPPRFGLVATPGEVTGNAAPDVAPAAPVTNPTAAPQATQSSDGGAD